MKPAEIIGELRKVQPSDKVKGIYLIYCFDAKKCYIGQSKSITRRWRKHCSDLRAGRHYNEYLQSSWNKYSSTSFECYILEECDNTNEREGYWANQIASEYLYNLGGIFSVFPMSNEQKQKIGLKHKGKILSEDHKKKLSISHKGQVAWNKGKLHSTAHREKLVKSWITRQPYSEAKRKDIYGRIALKAQGRKLTEDQKGNYYKAQRSKSPIDRKTALELLREFEATRSLTWNKDLKQSLAKKYSISIGLVNKIVYKNHWTTKK